jgi:hypothetical protein
MSSVLSSKPWNRSRLSVEDGRDDNAVGSDGPHIASGAEAQLDALVLGSWSIVRARALDQTRQVDSSLRNHEGEGLRSAAP